MEESVSVFPSSKHLDAWQSVNCAKCGKGDEIALSCALAISTLKSMYDGGRLPRSVAEKIGYVDSGDPVRQRASPYWRCREFEPR